MRTKIINLIGAPSVGKSVIAASLFAELKMKHFKAEYVQEYAKMLVWQNRLDELANQYNVSLQQYKMIKAIDNKVDYICVDSPLVIGLFYNRHFPDNICNIEKTEKMIKSKMEEFDNIYIYLQRNTEFPFEKEGRIHTEDEAKIIDAKILDLLNELNIDYKIFKSDRNLIPEMLDYIYNHNQNLNPKPISSSLIAFITETFNKIFTKFSKIF
jgi:nicotinamide riboside kinase